MRKEEGAARTGWFPSLRPRLLPSRPRQVAVRAPTSRLLHLSDRQRRVGSARAGSRPAVCYREAASEHKPLSSAAASSSARERRRLIRTYLFRGCRAALVMGASKRTVCLRSPWSVSAAPADRSQMMTFQSRAAVRRYREFPDQLRSDEIQSAELVAED